MRRLFLSLLLLGACDPDLTVAKPETAGGADAGQAPGPGPGSTDEDAGGSADAGDPDAASGDDAGAPKHVIDGNDDFLPGEKFLTSSAGYEAFVTWDDERVYLGMSGGDIGSGRSDCWVLVYIGGAGGTTSGLEYGGTQKPALPFPAAYHVRWKADGKYTNGQRWDGAGWVEAAGAGLVPVAMQKGTFMEMSIKRAAIGDPSKLQIHLSMLIEGGGQDWSYSAVPSTSFVDGLDPDYAKYFEFDLSDLDTSPGSYLPKP